MDDPRPEVRLEALMFHRIRPRFMPPQGDNVTRSTKSPRSGLPTRGHAPVRPGSLDGVAWRSAGIPQRGSMALPEVHGPKRREPRGGALRGPNRKYFHQK